LTEHIEVTHGVCGGKPRIAGHRITVQNIAIWHERLGKTADEIASEHELSLGDVYAALAYYFDNREEIDRSVRDDDAFVDQLQHQSKSKLKEKLVVG